MYTTDIIIAKGSEFTLRSYGNGAAYTLKSLNDNRSVYFQGDDADVFRGEYELAEKCNPLAPVDTLLGALWSDYESVAQDD